MPAKKQTVGVHSYDPKNCIPILVLIPTGEFLDAIKDGKPGVEELTSAYCETMKQEIRRIVREYMGGAG